MQNVVMLNVTMLSVTYAECRNAGCRGVTKNLANLIKTFLSKFTRSHVTTPSY
jgi:hypothetical protein